MNERRFSGTQRCVSCWDQTLLSRYGGQNHLVAENFQSDKGKARIDGVSGACGPNSEPAALLGVASKLLSFGGADAHVATSGRTLIGQGQESATIRYDIIRPPGILIGVLGEPGNVESQRIDLHLRSPAALPSGAIRRASGR